MDPKWAADNLQVIRTLMERSALYRRALAPVMIFAGIVGTIASGVAVWQKIDSARGFALFWVVTGLISVTGVILLIRRQALREVEPFWSLPTRRVAQAAVPPLFVGLVAAFPFVMFESQYPVLALTLIPAWLALYGCALCSAGSFMPRGIKLFGWFFVLAGCAVFLGAFYLPETVNARVITLQQAHIVMGVAFGIIHLLYGCYLYVTEQNRKNAA